MEPTNTQPYIGIDVSKDHLDLCWPGKKSQRIENARKPIQALVRKAGKIGATLVCESSGAYERILIRAAREAGVPLCVVNPARVRYFAKGKGILAKTDRIDATVIQAFAQENHPRPQRQCKVAEERLQAWVARRDQLVNELAREKKRLANSPELIKGSIERIIKALEDEIDQVEKHLTEAQKSDESLNAHATVLQEVTGVGPVTIWTLQAFLPELGEVSRRRIASLAGLAPWPNESGNWQGPRSIYGGRTRVRNVLYMAATAARLHNPHLRSYYQNLVSKGKPAKVATVAVMRKLLIHLNSLIHAQKNNGK